MTLIPPRLACIALLWGATTLHALAASSAASSASDSVTTSVGSVSGSIQRSSASSSNTTGVADGDYRIIEVATVAERPGLVRLTLRALAGPAVEQAEGEFFLFVPDTVAADSRLAQGGVISARQRPYGVEFAQGEAREAFFLVLTDAWYRELQTTPVVL